MDLFAQEIHQQLVVQRIEIFGEVDFYRVAIPLFRIFFYFPYGLLRASLRAIAVASLRKERLKQGCSCWAMACWMYLRLTIVQPFPRKKTSR
nr:hypothetical protein [Paenibacillus sp. BJ-4]